MFTVPAKVHQDRLSICHACKHFRKATGSCGTLIVGNKLSKEETAQVNAENTVTRNRSKIKLCGCVMRIKAKLILAECPVGKWGKFKVTDADLKKMRKFIDGLQGRDTLTWNEVVQIYAYGSTLSEVDMKATTCPSCVREMLEKVRLTIKERDPK